jgi:hypothetical protein
MPKFVQVSVAAGTYSEAATEDETVYINIEQIKYVVQNQQNQNHSSIHFVGDDHPLHISESATSLLDRCYDDLALSDRRTKSLAPA